MKDKKRVVYLFGTGASQGEISSSDDAIRICMNDIKDDILQRITNDDIKELKIVSNELSEDNCDVEHLITLYEATGTYEHKKIALELKRLFREEIQKKLKLLGSDYKTKLFSALIDMYQINEIDEVIKGIITLNYEDLLEKAVMDVLGSINYSLDIKSDNKYINNINPNQFPVLKLHGSFNWKNEFPINVIDEDNITNDDEILWIPPGVEKKKDNYPFSLLWGKAKEILLCDILRVVGCSLSRNDWGIISLLYSTQKLNSQKNEYTIEIIDYPITAEKIKKIYSYLKICPFMEIPEVKKYMISTYKPACIGTTIPDSEMKEIEKNITPEKTNIFDLWLKAKGDDLIDKGFSLDTNSSKFKNFYEGG